MPIGREGGTASRKETAIEIAGEASANNVTIPGDAVELVAVVRHSNASDAAFVIRAPVRSIEAQTAGMAGDTSYLSGAVSGEAIGVKIRRKAGGTIRLDRLSADQTLADAWWTVA